MAIVSISRGSHSRGAEVAQIVARKLGYACLAREVLLEASEEFNIPEIQLVKAIENPPSVFDRITHGKTRYIAYIRVALLKSFLADNIVYHGLAGHIFLQGVRHALKVRIIADLQDRVGIVVSRDQISEQEAQRTLARSDKARRQWGLQMYGVDPEDPSQYDAVIHVGRMGTDGAARMICDLAGQEQFQSTPETRAALEDLYLGAAVQVQLAEMQLAHPEAEVTCRRGEIMVRLKPAARVHGGSYSGFDAHYRDDVRRRLTERARELHGFKGLEVELLEG